MNNHEERDLITKFGAATPDREAVCKLCGYLFADHGITGAQCPHGIKPRAFTALRYEYDCIDEWCAECIRVMNEMEDRRFLTR